MRVAIIGAGAVGGWLAGVLMRGGADVALLARGAAHGALLSRSLVLLEHGKAKVFSPHVSNAAAHLPRSDLVVFAVKTHQFAAAVADAAPLLEGGPVVATAMNGLPWWFLDGPAGALANARLSRLDPGPRALRALQGVRPLGVVVHASVTAVEPATIKVTAVDRLILGEPTGRASDETRELVRHLEAGGVRSVITSEIRSEIWAKLWGNMNFNPVSALTRRTSRGIFDDPWLLQLLRDMMHEFGRVGERIGIQLPSSAEERLAVAQRLGDFRTSMLNDLDAGRPLEVDGLLGVVVEMAAKLGEAVPASRAVYALARTLPGGGSTAPLRTD
jgi:2-dehydropantoate 2-reductase